MTSLEPDYTLREVAQHIRADQLVTDYVPRARSVGTEEAA